MELWHSSLCKIFYIDTEMTNRLLPSDLTVVKDWISLALLETFMLISLYIGAFRAKCTLPARIHINDKMLFPKLLMPIYIANGRWETLGKIHIAATN